MAYLDSFIYKWLIICISFKSCISDDLAAKHRRGQHYDRVKKCRKITGPRATPATTHVRIGIGRNDAATNMTMEPNPNVFAELHCLIPDGWRTPMSFHSWQLSNVSSFSSHSFTPYPDSYPSSHGAACNKLRSYSLALCSWNKRKPNTKPFPPFSTRRRNGRPSFDDGFVRLGV